WPFSLTHVQQITFHQATLLPASQQLFNHSPISANSVQFLASKLLWQSAQHQILAENIDGGFTPLSKTATPDTISRFKFTAGKVSVDQFIFNAFYLQGYQQHHQTYITHLGSDMQQGGLTAAIQINQQHKWLIKKLGLNNLRLNSQQPIELSSALVNWPSLPDIEIKQLMLTNGTIESPNLKASELNLTLTNLALVQGKIASEQSRLHLDADTLIYNEQQFQQTNVELTLSPSAI